jgi:hypothetical protein
LPRARGSLAVSAGLITAVKIIIKKFTAGRRVTLRGAARPAGVLWIHMGDRGFGLRVGLSGRDASCHASGGRGALD